ncbi:MAG TPA: hypothetical protein VG603_15755 [Chitinophagales bacterium]|nr:hypothetical protein [Chitinophagales bacterium]
MFKKGIAILLLSALLAQTSVNLLLFASYEVNKTYIATHLCENRDKPQLHCNGHCHLVKELNNEEKKDQSPAGNLKEHYEMPLFSETSYCQVPLVIAQPVNFIPAYLIKPYSTILYSVFHPPQA